MLSIQTLLYRPDSGDNAVVAAVNDFIYRINPDPAHIALQLIQCFLLQFVIQDNALQDIVIYPEFLHLR